MIASIWAQMAEDRGKRGADVKSDRRPYRPDWRRLIDFAPYDGDDDADKVPA
jgi:hypothetical protein